MMGDRIELLVKNLREVNSTMLLLSKQMNEYEQRQKSFPQRAEIQKVNTEIGDDSEMDSESMKKSSEQLDRKFPATTTVTASIKKNHTSVVEVMEENHHEPNNKVNSMLKLNEASKGNGKDFIVCIESGKSEKGKSPNTKVERQRAHSVDLRLPSKPPNVEVEPLGFDQPTKVRSRREPPAKPPDRSVALDKGGYGRADVERRRIQTKLLRPPLSPDPPDADRLAAALSRRASPHMTSYLNGEKDLEIPRVKREFAKVGNHFNLMGQIHTSLPSIFHHNNLLHVLSSGQYSNFHVSPKEQPLPLAIATYPSYTMQSVDLTGQTQVNICLFFEIFSLWARVKLSGWAQIKNNSTWVEEKSNSNILSQTRNFVFPYGFSAESIASHHKCSPSSNLCYVCKEESQSIVKIREFEQEIVVYGSLSLPLEKFKQVRYKGYQKVAIISACAFPLCKCFGRHIKRFSVKLEVGALDKDVIAIVNSYLMSGNWALVLEGFYDKRVWNLIAFNFVTESFNLKAPNEKIVDVSQWMESKEVSPKTIRNSWINEMSLILSSKLRDMLVLCIEGFAADDSIKGIVRLLGMKENAALTIVDAANELDGLLAKYVADAHRWSENEEMSPYTTMWYSLISEFAQQGMCLEVLKYFRSMMLLVHICSRTFMSWFIAYADPLLLSNGKEVNGCSLKSLANRNHLLSTTLIEMLRRFWNTMMGTFEEMKAGFDCGMMFLHAIILNKQWDPEEFNFPMATTTDDYCWGDLLIFPGWFNFVFDRGKFDGCKISSTLRTRLFEEVGIDRDLNHEVGLDFGPSLRCGKEGGRNERMLRWQRMHEECMCCIRNWLYI
ncbi:uncharacterized protein LOC123913976 [Trifolium pratense]|nr:uncharacterized protein LOC123913976 [Trifolium pratense]